MQVSLKVRERVLGRVGLRTRTARARAATGTAGRGPAPSAAQRTAAPCAAAGRGSHGRGTSGRGRRGGSSRCSVRSLWSCLPGTTHELRHQIDQNNLLAMNKRISGSMSEWRGPAK